MSTEQLPNEVLERIVDYAVTVPTATFEAWRELTTYALTIPSNAPDILTVSRRWHDLGIPYLYEAAILRTSQQAEAYAAALQNPRMRPFRLGHRLRRLRIESGHNHLPEIINSAPDIKELFLGMAQLQPDDDIIPDLQHAWIKLKHTRLYFIAGSRRSPTSLMDLVIAEACRSKSTGDVISIREVTKYTEVALLQARMGPGSKKIYIGQGKDMVAIRDFPAISVLKEDPGTLPELPDRIWERILEYATHHQQPDEELSRRHPWLSRARGGLNHWQTDRRILLVCKQFHRLGLRFIYERPHFRRGVVGEPIPPSSFLKCTHLRVIIFHGGRANGDSTDGLSDALPQLEELCLDGVNSSLLDVFTAMALPSLRKFEAEGVDPSSLESLHQLLQKHGSKLRSLMLPFNTDMPDALCLCPNLIELAFPAFPWLSTGIKFIEECESLPFLSRIAMVGHDTHEWVDRQTEDKWYNFAQYLSANRAQLPALEEVRIHRILWPVVEHESRSCLYGFIAYVLRDIGVALADKLGRRWARFKPVPLGVMLRQKRLTETAAQTEGGAAR
ncbi:hypothetical protein FKP32DRAFT_513468 [Trametes sanguinea]|nr:hypothetical protein FKP32DRAFT_513468 [Trametes sanguinea]